MQGLNFYRFLDMIVDKMSRKYGMKLLIKLNLPQTTCI